MDTNILTELTLKRKYLHANPELSLGETNTQQFILDFLRTNTSAEIQRIAGTGVLALFDSGQPGPVVLIRGDIDALPIEETNSFEHQSIHKGISHKCGHDGHTVILMGLGLELTKKNLHKGKVFLLFQPAEEIGMGAQLVLNDPVFNQLEIDFVFALHNLPGFATHEIVLKENEFTPNVQSAVLILQGKTAHAAEPEKGFNPAPVLAEIIRFAESNTRNNPDLKDFFLITPVYAMMGEKAYGISAGYAEIHLTLRSHSLSLMKEKSNKLEEFVRKVSNQYGVFPELSWIQVFTANKNHTAAIDIIRKAASRLSLKTREIHTPFKWGEDFGLFTQKFKGALFGLGAGTDSPALHNPDYDYPDEITPTGIQMFLGIIQEIHNS